MDNTTIINVVTKNKKEQIISNIIINVKIIYNFIFIFLINNIYVNYKIYFGLNKMGIGDWGLGIAVSTFLVFHIDISGKEDKEEQLKNIAPITLALLIFHIDISGNEDNDEQSANIELISTTLLVFHFAIFGRDNKDLQFPNRSFI